MVYSAAWVGEAQKISTFIDTNAGNKAFIEEYFIDGVVGIQFAIISNMLYMLAIFKVIMSVNVTAPRIITINDQKYFPKVLANGHVVMRASAFPMITTAVTGLDQLIFRVIKSTDGKQFYVISQQSLSVNEIYCIPAITVGFVS